MKYLMRSIVKMLLIKTSSSNNLVYNISVTVNTDKFQIKDLRAYIIYTSFVLFLLFGIHVYVYS